MLVVLNLLLLFDWDQTLSVCNGIYMPVDSDLDKDTEEALAKKVIYRRRCYIITNNGWGDIKKTKYLQSDAFFLKMLHTIDPWMKEDNIIYGRVEGGKVRKFKDNAGLMKHYKTLKKRRL